MEFGIIMKRIELIKVYYAPNPKLFWSPQENMRLSDKCFQGFEHTRKQFFSPTGVLSNPFVHHCDQGRHEEPSYKADSRFQEQTLVDWVGRVPNRFL